MSDTKIPEAVLLVVGDVLGSYFFSHNRLNSLFAEKGAPGEPPEGNCVKKCQAWLRRCNEDETVNQFEVLGGVLEGFMEVDETFRLADQEAGRKRIRDTMARYHFTYEMGGHIFGAAVALPTKTLETALRNRDVGQVDAELRRALAHVERDPPSTLTAASSLLEALFKVYIEDENLTLPKKQTIGDLWAIVRNHIGFDPASIEDDDLKKILQGMASIVDGIGSARTHMGSAHGRGRRAYAVQPRHARLAAHAAHTMALFILETWDHRKQKP